MSSDVEPATDREAIRVFTKTLLRDLQALQRMIEEGMIESGVRRFGAEQELFLVNQGGRPAPVATRVLNRLGGGPFTTELALFNLEINLEPLLLEGACFTALEERVEALVEHTREAARAEGADVVLAGILPTLAKSDLSMENITPRPRYHALNEAMTRMRGGTYRLRIEGTDELHVEHDSVMLEACNTSCQVHLQVSAEEFAHCYNVAQLVTAPVLAAAVNSPLLFGRRLWAETRIALFQQSLDTRSTNLHMRELSPRVRFGEGWVEDSVTELFQEDIARFRVLMAQEIEEDPMEVLEAGGVPRLEALQLHNSTVYRWNRPCYGISDGKPHLRIECRALPAGPTIIDEVANAAFWIGLVTGMARSCEDVPAALPFDEAKANFLAAARQGLRAGLHWIDGETVAARDLILENLLPLARTGLVEAGVDEADAERYLGIIEERVETGTTGADWALRSLAELEGEGTRGERLAALVAATARNQREGTPVHRWELAGLEEAGEPQQTYLRVEQYMVTDLFTVNEEELVEMVAFLMDSRQIRQVLVEDDEHRLVGLVSYRSILRMVAAGDHAGVDVPVREIMERDPMTCAPETPTTEAIEMMRKERISCLPVTKDGRLVGLVSERDFMPMVYELLQERLAGVEEG